MDEIDRIIACVEDHEVQDIEDWASRHEEQAEGDLFYDQTELGGGESYCVAYEPSVELDITYKEGAPSEEMVDVLEDAIFKGSFANVSVPARVDCEHYWQPETHLPVFDGATEQGPGEPYYVAGTTICMPPEDFLRIQYAIAVESIGTDSTIEEWASPPHVNEEQVGYFEEYLETGEVVGEEDNYYVEEGIKPPRPFLELDRDGKLVPNQEGRHRAVAAMNQGLPLMDVYVFANADTTRGKPEYKYTDPPEVTRL